MVRKLDRTSPQSPPLRLVSRIPWLVVTTGNTFPKCSSAEAGEPTFRMSARLSGKPPTSLLLKPVFKTIGFIICPFSKENANPGVGIRKRKRKRNSSNKNNSQSAKAHQNSEETLHQSQVSIIAFPWQCVRRCHRQRRHLYQHLLLQQEAMKGECGVRCNN